MLVKCWPHLPISFGITINGTSTLCVSGVMLNNNGKVVKCVGWKCMIQPQRNKRSLKLHIDGLFQKQALPLATTQRSALNIPNIWQWNKCYCSGIYRSYHKSYASKDGWIENKSHIYAHNLYFPVTQFILSYNAFIWYTFFNKFYHNKNKSMKLWRL